MTANHNLLTFENAKTSKGEKLGFLTAILYLSPADLSGLINVCPKASAGCKAVCLNTAGRGAFDQVQAGRLRKTKLYVENREEFYAGIANDIRKAIRKAERENLTLAVRLNGTSDLPSLGRRFALMFPDVQFYDYTKLPRPETRTLPNYHLTFSRSETNEVDALNALKNGVNVAIVFDTKRNGTLPKTYKGFKVINGDEHDLRFLDKRGRKYGFVVGLTAKGKARKDTSGFVVLTRKAA
jgi:hypothetical protein